MALPMALIAIAQAVLSKSNNNGARKLGSALSLLSKSNKTSANQKTMPGDDWTYR